MNLIIFGASTLKVYLSQPFIFFPFLSCYYLFSWFKSSFGQNCATEKKNVSNEFHGMMDRSAEYVLDYTQIKKR